MQQNAHTEYNAVLGVMDSYVFNKLLWNIELDPYEFKDLLQVLEYAQEEYKYRANFDNSGLPNYWVQRIEHLKKVIKELDDKAFIEQRALTAEERKEYDELSMDITAWECSKKMKINESLETD